MSQVSMRLSDIKAIQAILSSAVKNAETNQEAPLKATLGDQEIVGHWANPSNYESGFRFGATSEKELVGVRDELVQLAHVALARSKQDFMVFDGLRTAAEQKALVAKGASKTMDSKHLTGDAIDLVPYINGKPTWDWEGCYRVACAVDQAARELGIEHKIRWGGAWDRTLADFHGDATAYKRVVEEYAARQKAKGKSAFLDGPHFEWIK